MNRVDGKIALVSGGARGIGGECARRLAEHGAKVVIGDILEAEGEQTALEIRNAGYDAVYVKLDVTQAAGWENALGIAVKNYGGLDVLVNNAAIYIGKTILNTTASDFAALIAVNLQGVFLGTQICAPELLRRAQNAPVGSSIINISSAAGIIGSRTAPVYSMTKGGVRLFSKSTALEFAKKRVRCNSVHPGLIETEMGNTVLTIAARGTRSSNEIRETWAKSHPIGRLGEPRDIAGAVVFLASDDSAFMTGSEFLVDGGVTAQ